METSAQLGLGLIAIGRAWGHDMAAPPPESEARALLETACELGVKVYDTAPAYGTSERILGAFLRTLTDDQRRTIFVTTKFGEHWNEDGTTRVDHSYDGARVRMPTSRRAVSPSRRSGFRIPPLA